MDIKLKKLSIKEYFDEWQKRIDKAEKLLLDTEYGLEGLTVLLCYIGAFAYLRYRKGRDRENYIKIVKEYSGFRDIYDKIDIDKFCNADILYKYFRCSAVHQGNFPLINKRTLIEDGAVRYESNSIITIDLIIKTVKNIYSNLRQQCLKEVKWMHEL